MQGCPVCTADAAVGFLHRPRVAVHQNLVLADAASARAYPRGELWMARCTACGFAWNQRFDERRVEYSKDYDNRQELSAHFREHLDGRAAALIDALGTGPVHLAEVGCGKGGFLDRLLQAAPNWRAVGLDPTYVGPRESHGGRLRFEPRRLHASGVRCDAVLSRHVIEHVPEPLSFLLSLRASLAEGARLFLETPDLDWILDQAVPFDFFYEHCSLFDGGSLQHLLARAGFLGNRVERVFGGQYLWVEARAVAIPKDVPTPDVDPALAARTAVLRNQLAAREAHWARWLPSLAARGPVVLWGAGAKGATLAELMDPEQRFLRAAVDVNPAKQGNYMVGSGLPVIAPKDLASLRPAAVLLPNPNYSEEVSAELQRLGLNLVPIDPLLKESTDP